jgi:hypothetical protein
MAIYYHGSFKNFKSFKNKQSHAVGGEGVFLKVGGNFFTQNRMFAMAFTPAPIRGYEGTKGYLYKVEIALSNILDLRLKEHKDLVLKHLKIELKTLPKWDNYAIIEFAKKKKFEGVFLIEEYGVVKPKKIVSLFVFDPKSVAIIAKEIVTDLDYVPTLI